jgi:hypothetical protein
MFKVILIFLLSITNILWVHSQTEPTGIPESFLMVPNDQNIVIILDEDNQNSIDQKRQRKFLRSIKNKSKELIDKANVMSKEEINKFKIEVKQDLLSLGGFKVAARYDTVPLKNEEVYHDPQKHTLVPHQKKEGLYLKKWNKITIGTTMGIRPDIEILGLFQGTGIFTGPGLSFEAQRKQLYTFIVPSKKTVIDQEKQIFKRSIDRLGLALGGFKHISLPNDPKKIIEKYPTGSEIEIERFQKVYTSIGPTIGIHNVSAYARFYCSITGIIKNRVKVIELGGKKYIRLRISTATYNRNSREFGGRLTFDAFEILNGFSLAVNVNFLSSRTEFNKNTEIVFDYTFDPDYPEAVHAFKRALRGDLSPVQEMAIFRNQGHLYQGVTINQQKTSELRNKIKKISYGLFIDGTKLKALMLDVSARESTGSFIKFTRKKTVSDRFTNIEANYLEDQQQLVHSIQCEKRYSLIFDLLGKKIRKCSVSNEIVQVNKILQSTESPDAEGELSKLSVHKLSYSFNYFASKSKKIFREIITNLKYFVGINDFKMQFTINQILENPDCHKDLTFTQKGNIFLDSFDKVFLSDKEKINEAFAAFIGDKRKEYWVDYNSDQNKNRISQLNKRTKADPQLHRRFKKSLDLYHYFNKNELWNSFRDVSEKPEEFLKDINVNAGKIQNREALAKWSLLNKVIDELGENPMLFEFLHLLTMGSDLFPINQQSSSLNGSRTSIVIDGGEKCQYNWWFSGNSIFPYNNIGTSQAL